MSHLIFFSGWHNGSYIFPQEVIQMTAKWKSTEEQNTGPISRVTEFFIDELNELQEELDCPDEFIYDLMEAIRNRWSPDSCHAHARKLKRENSDY